MSETQQQTFKVNGTFDMATSGQSVPLLGSREAWRRELRTEMVAGNWPRAEEIARWLKEVEPKDEGDCLSLCIALSKQHRLKEAIHAAFGLTSADSYLLRASCCEELNSWADAEEITNVGLEAYPNHHGLLFARGLQRLRKGDVAGWADYEHRPPRLKLLTRIEDIREWDGQPGTGILAILGQQGIGDQIMFSRWIPEAVERWGGQVYIYAHIGLVRLFAAAFPQCTVIGSDAESPEGIDAWISIDSLPHVLKSYHAEPINIAANVPPLDAIQFDGDAFRVGLCWAGAPEHDRDWLRSMKWEDFSRFIDQENRAERVEFHSLQKDKTTADGVIDNAHLLFDMADTAAYIAQLDMVITVDTAVAHLAGVMGKRLILVTPGEYLEWRWTYCHWYQSLNRMKANNICALITRKENTSTVSTQPIRTVETKRGPFRIFSADRWISRSLAIYGEWSRGEGELFEEFVKLGDTVVEAGVNLGWHMAHFADLVGKDGMVWGFEPNPSTVHLATENVFGLDRCPCEATIQVAALSNNSVAESTFYFDPTHPAGAHVENGEERKGESFPVTLVRLDDYRLERVDFLKADVEGHELAVLKGAEETIMRCRPYLYVENDRPDNMRELMLWIHAHDYRMYRHQPLLYPGKDCGKPNVFGSIVSGMLFAVPREKFPKIPQALGLSRVIVERENQFVSKEA